MAEGPIRRACNRCHTQKLSCKRLGNEPCERCVRLKAECKSSPSLRFRKPSNSTSNGCKPSSIRHIGNSQQEQRSQKLATNGMGNLPVYTEAGLPYAGPYSFNGMAEHLWPGHNVDAGLLIYHSDGNEIYQALSPQQLSFQIESKIPFRQDLVTSPMEEILESSHFFNTTPSSSALPLTNSLSHSWAAPSVSHGSCGTGLVGTNGCGWKSGVEAEAATKAILETSFLSHVSHNGDNTGNSLPGGTSRCDSSHPSMKISPHKRHATQHGPLKTVTKSLISHLCDMSAQLWDMSNAISIAGNDENNVLGGMHFPRNNSQSMAPSGMAPSTHDSTHGSTHSGDQSPVGSTHDGSFLMDGLFAVSRNFIQTVQIACHDQGGESGQASSHGFDTTTIGGEPVLGAGPFTRTNRSKSNTMSDTSNDRVDAESFVVLADSTYAALLEVYQRVFHLVDMTASSERPPSPPHNGNGAKNGNGHFMGPSEGGLKQSLHSVTTPSSWRDSAALSCLKVCRFPDVSVGGFPIVSTPELQLGLGLRLADDFLAHFSHAVAVMHSCFYSTPREDNVSVSAAAEQQQLLPAVNRTHLPHPPLVISEDLFTSDGFGASMDWDISTATSLSSSSGSKSFFSLQYGLGMHRPSSMDDIVIREHDLRQELAGLRNKLAA